MVLEAVSICYEKRHNGRLLADSCYSSSLWLYLCSYELHLPQLDTLTGKIKGGGIYIAKTDANHPTPFKPLTYVLPVGRYGVEKEAVYLSMQIL